ncbi:unnamed protein product [Closterium sp. NIES-54]
MTQHASTPAEGEVALDAPKSIPGMNEFRQLLADDPVGGWDKAWQASTTPWDLGGVTPAVAALVAAQEGSPLHLPPSISRVLVPGCGTVSMRNDCFLVNAMPWVHGIAWHGGILDPRFPFPSPSLPVPIALTFPSPKLYQLTKPLLHSPLHSSPLLSSPLHSSPLLSSPLLSAPLLSSPLLSAPLLSSPLLSAPLLSSPLLSAPLLSTPLRSSPLLSSPLLSSPLLSAPPLSSPLLSSPLLSSPLLSFPVHCAPFVSALPLSTALHSPPLHAIGRFRVHQSSPILDGMAWHGKDQNDGYRIIRSV